MPRVLPFKTVPMPKFTGMAVDFSPDCCQAPCFKWATYCGTRRAAAMMSAHVSSAGAVGEPTPSATATPRSVQAPTSIWLPTRPVWAIILSFGSFSISCRFICVLSRISTMTSASLRRTDNWPMPLTVLVYTLAGYASSLAAQASLRTASW